MDARSRFIMVVLMTAIMVFMVTLIATYLNLGLSPGFLGQWAKAYAVAWPVAAITGFLVMPMARRGTEKIVGWMDGRN